MDTFDKPRYNNQPYYCMHNICSPVITTIVPLLTLYTTLFLLNIQTAQRLTPAIHHDHHHRHRASTAHDIPHLVVKWPSELCELYTSEQHRPIQICNTRPIALAPFSVTDQFHFSTNRWNPRQQSSHTKYQIFESGGKADATHFGSRFTVHDLYFYLNITCEGSNPPPLS